MRSTIHRFIGLGVHKDGGSGHWSLGKRSPHGCKSFVDGQGRAWARNESCLSA